MSNNEQSMKLYTEEEMRKAFHCGRLYLGREGDTNFYHFIDKLTPIKLPSDEEIENLDTFLISDVDSFIRGAKWMRDKIQGGNNEQQ